MEKIKKNDRSYYLPSIEEVEDSTKVKFGKSITISIKDNIYLGIYGQYYILPKGLHSDGASIPKLLQWLMGSGYDRKVIIPGMLHDYFYRSQFIDKKVADSIFYDLLIIYGNGKIKSWLMYKAVSKFGNFAWKNNKKHLIKLPNAKYDLTKFICNGGFNILIDNK